MVRLKQLTSCHIVYYIAHLYTLCTSRGRIWRVLRIKYSNICCRNPRPVLVAPKRKYTNFILVWQDLRCDRQHSVGRKEGGEIKRRLVLFFE